MRREMDALVKHNIAEDFWLQKLKNVTFNPIFSDRKIPGDTSKKILGQWILPFSNRLTEIVNTVTEGSNAKAFILFITALNILMHKYTGHNDILVTTTEIQEDSPGDRSDVLLFFRTNIDPASIPRDLLNHAYDDLNTAYEHCQFDYKSFFKRFGEQKVGDSKALSALGFIYEDFNRDNQWLEGIDLLFRIERPNREFLLIIKYDTQCYEQEEIKQLGRHFTNCLNSMAESLDKTVQHIDILSRDDYQKLLVDFCGEEIHYQRQEKTFIPCLENQVEKTPHSTAVICEEKVFNYRELNEICNQTARYFLKEVSLRQEDFVVILMDRSEKMVESIIATWKCGAAYVPVDPDFPDDRIKTIIEDSRAKLVVSEQGTLRPGLEEVLNPVTKILYLDKPEEIRKSPGKANLEITVAPGNLAYVIYTSGSTGKPKGVMVEHLGMMNHLHAKVADIQIGAESVIAQNASHCFDISVWQFFAALLVGGRTVVYGNQMVLNPEAFTCSLSSDLVTVLEVVPSYLTMMMDIIDERKLKNLFPGLKHLLVTGEVLRAAVVKRWFEKFPGIEMVNAYGPTEASDDITHFIMKQFPGMESIPIGRTVRNFRIYIVDGRMNLCPPGVKGEICVSGIGVGRGYLNDSSKTGDAFIEDPFRNIPGVRMYRTGDIGRYLPNGSIEFFGRKDYQVKIRGYRIELEEIENKLAAMDGVREAVVIDKEDEANNKYLCAYITLVDGMEKTTEEIKRGLRNILPEYMIPAHIVILDVIPLTPNGKVDRKALPEPGGSGLSAVEYVAPGNSLEKKLVDIWQEILGVEKISIHDNFFNLGGDSFKGIRIINKIQDWLQEVVHVTVLFLAPTIAELALKLESYRKADNETGVDAAKIAEIRSLIQPLPPLPSHLKRSTKTPPVMFILCPSRSGSTLLRVILAGHPKLFAPQEFELLSFNTLQQRKEALSGAFSLYLEGVIRAIMEIKQIDADDAKAIMEAFETQGMTVQEFYGIFQHWLEGRMLVEKTPQYTYDLEVLKRAEEYFDSPLYIHLIRHPYAVIHSYENARLDQLFKYEHRYSSRQLGELLWLTCHQNILEFLENIPANRKYPLKYEDLVSDPGYFVSQMCNHFGLEFYPAMLNIYGEADKRMTDGIHPESKMLGDVKFFSHKSIDTQSVEKWKEKYKTDFLSEEAMGLAQSFGYLKEKIGPDYSRLAPVPKAEYYELSHAQKRLWFLNQLDKINTAYNIINSVILEGDPDLNVLRKVFEALVRRHESLRTTFISLKAGPAQKIHDFEDSGFSLQYIDLRNEKDHDTQVKKLLIEETAAPFDLEKGPLFKVKLLHCLEKKYVLIFNMYHIISDGWSMRLLIKEILILYSMYRDNTPNPLPPLRFQYKDYSIWQNREAMYETLKRQENYWIKEIAGEITPLNLPTDYPRPVVQDFSGDITNFMIAADETAAFNKVANSEGATLFMVLMTVYYLLLAKISGQEDIVVGTPIAGRNHPDVEHIIGMFVNTLAIRSCPAGEKTFISFLREVKGKILKAFENQDFQLENLVEKVALHRDMSRNPLFDVVFVFQNFSDIPGASGISEDEIGGMKIKPYSYRDMFQTAKFDLTLSAVEKNRELFFSIEYCTALFKEETIERFINYFKKIVSIVVNQPGIRINNVEVISEEEKKRILFDFNDNQTGYPKEQTIQQLFEEQVAQTPDRVALVGPDIQNNTAVLPVQPVRPVRPVSLTYNRLNEETARLAGLLKEKGVVPDTIVGIMIERSLEMIIGILAILKAGGAYLPIDPAYPRERIEFMLRDSNVDVLLTNPKLQVKAEAGESSRQPGLPLEFIHVHPNPAFATRPTLSTCQAGSGNLAYVIYTSGTTGKPKGTLTTHSNVFRVVKNTNYIEITGRDRVLQLSNYAFDGSVFDIYGALLNGAVLVMIKEEDVLAMDNLSGLIKREGITLFFVTTALFNTLVSLEIDCFERVRKVLFGGEQVSMEHSRKALDALGKDKIIHVYGPTETTVYAAAYPINQVVKKQLTIPIGNPISNTTVYILDKYLDLVPPMVYGEIYIGGDGVCRGYLNNPELTAERFCLRRPGGSFRENRPLDPCKSFSLNHSPLYKTGDLARWLSDGNIEFFGRIDHQVKIRGFRIELGEIESCLARVNGVKETVVMAREEAGGDKYICAYFVSDREYSLAELRNELAGELPDYMIPSYFMQVEEIPITPSGKIDRTALLKMTTYNLKSDQDYVEPQKEIEIKISSIWKELLHTEKVGIYHDFFEMGGNSLKVIQLKNRLTEELNKNIPVVALFQHPTIHSLVEYLTGTEEEDVILSDEVDKLEKINRAKNTQKNIREKRRKRD